ncbi:MAG TPA: pyrophosphatase [Porphyromonadaceae bacterium]|nr:pyrophosphatase [Porphyromonadaceae bacterium]
MTFEEAQQSVDEWIKKCGVRYFNELTNMVLLTEEVGELARIVGRVYGEQSFKESDKEYNMPDEMADILFCLICLANQAGINLSEAFQRNLEKKYIRDKDRHIHNEKLFSNLKEENKK